jgi:oligoribonuclease
VLASKDMTEDVEKELLGYIQRYVPVKGEAHLAGNSVHFDKAFMEIEFPSVTDWLHYRIIGNHPSGEVEWS